MFSSRLWNLFIDSFPKMFIRGLTVTIPLTAIAFSLAMVIAVIVALVQFAKHQSVKADLPLLYLDLFVVRHCSSNCLLCFWVDECWSCT
mgnify:CR=1 FL=1